MINKHKKKIRNMNAKKKNICFCLFKDYERMKRKTCNFSLVVKFKDFCFIVYLKNREKSIKKRKYLDIYTSVKILFSNST